MKINDLDQRFTNATGAFFSLFFGGFGSHGVAENYFESEDAKETKIYVNTQDMHINAARVNHGGPVAASEAAAPIESQTQEQSVEDWFHAVRDEAAAAQMRDAADQIASHEISRGREQSLYPLAVDPVAYYGQLDDDEDHSLAMRG